MNKYSIVIVLILIFGKVVYESSRFLPLKDIAFRPWEALVEEPSGIGAFKAHQSLHFDNAFGDLANIGNLPHLRVYRSETMSTDACGARKQSYSYLDEVDGYYLGTSFGAGAANDDKDLITEILFRKTGLRIYNLAVAKLSDAQMAQISANTKLRRKIIILEVLERNQPEDFTGMYWREEVSPSVDDPCVESKEVSIIASFEKVMKLHPRLPAIVNKGLKLLQNDVILPNSHRRQILERTFQANDKAPSQEMLFLPQEVSVEGKSRDPRATATALVQAANYWSQKGFEVLFLFIPDKVTVNNDFLKEQFHLENQNYFPVVHKELEDMKFKVVDLTEPLKNATRLTGHPHYHLDDTHWNPAGVELGAELLAKTLKTTRPAFGPR